MKKRYAIPLGLIAIIAAAAFLLRTPDADPAAMEAKYTNEQSRFAEGPNGLRVHYRDEGDRQGIPIVLLHGNSASLHTWEPLVARLGDKYRIITLTFPGHGLTGPNANHDYSVKGMIEALELVLDETGVDHFVLGGNSMGGWISWRYALAHPERVDALILIDAFGMPLREGETPPPLNLGFKMMQHPVGRFLLNHYTPRIAVRRSLLQTMETDAIVTDEMVDRYWELLRMPGNRKAAGERWIVDREMEYADRIGEITAPTLIIWGAEDQLIYPSAAQTFAERMPDADAVIYDGVGHIPMEEAPDRTAGDIDSFLEYAFRPALQTP